MQSEQQQPPMQTLQHYFRRFTQWRNKVMPRHFRWHHPLIGSLVSLVLVGLGLGIGLVEAQFLFPFSFPGVLLLFVVLVVAFLWGTMPALFTVLLSLLVLDYLYIPPFREVGSSGWSGIIQLLTFAGAGIGITILTHQREVARVKTVMAEARANELSLREANRRMEEFLSIVCHELKTPLTVMRGSVQLAERKIKRLVESDTLPSDELRRFAPVQALLERTKSQISIQDRIVNDLLDISRIQNQTLKLLKRPCNLVSIVQEAVEDQRQAEPARTILLTLPPQKEVSVYGDTERLIQVITNYLTNALKYSAVSRPVYVRLTVEEGTSARLAVKDEGPGLPPEEREHIWQRFYRVEGIEVQSGSGVGLGVGLHLCRTIVEQHQGRVGVQSQPGAGSTFWFTLPLDNGL